MRDARQAGWVNCFSICAEYNAESPKQGSRRFNVIVKTKYIAELGIVYLCNQLSASCGHLVRVLTVENWKLKAKNLMLPNIPRIWRLWYRIVVAHPSTQAVPAGCVIHKPKEYVWTNYAHGSGDKMIVKYLNCAINETLLFFPKNQRYFPPMTDHPVHKEQ